MTDFVRFILPLAQDAPAAPGPDPTNMIFMMVAIGLAFYLIILRPQNKERRQREQQLATLSKGDKVITIGGFHGRITAIAKAGDTVEIELAKNNRVTMNRSAVASIVKGGKTEEATDAP